MHSSLSRRLKRRSPDSFMAQSWELEPALVHRRQQQLYRERLTLQGPAGPTVSINGNSCINFCANDYLGLAADSRVIAAAQKALADYGLGSGASHLVCGHNVCHQQLEEALADFTGRPRALLFSTGYMANLGTVTALAGRGDLVLEDRLNHASLLDAGMASGARFLRYRHADMAHLEARLQCSAQRTLIVTDGVFSMDGDSALLGEICDLAEAYNAWVMVDDAHGLGVLGNTGGGSLEAAGVAHRVPVLMGTLGKALGSFGAFVAGSEALVETLIQFARTAIYTTAMPPAIAAATLTSLSIARAEHWRRERLRVLAGRFRDEALAMGYTLLDSSSPIQPLLAGDAALAVALSHYLRERGLLVTAIRPPTVPDGGARLRVTFSALHEDLHLERLLDALHAARCKFPAMVAAGA